MQDTNIQFLTVLTIVSVFADGIQQAHNTTQNACLPAPTRPDESETRPSSEKLIDGELSRRSLAGDLCLEIEELFLLRTGSGRLFLHPSCCTGSSVSKKTLFLLGLYCGSKCSFRACWGRRMHFQRPDGRKSPARSAGALLLDKVAGVQLTPPEVHDERNKSHSTREFRACQQHRATRKPGIRPVDRLR